MYKTCLMSERESLRRRERRVRDSRRRLRRAATCGGGARAPDRWAPQCRHSAPTHRHVRVSPARSRTPARPPAPWLAAARRGRASTGAARRAARAAPGPGASAPTALVATAPTDDARRHDTAAPPPRRSRRSAFRHVPHSPCAASTLLVQACRCETHAFVYVVSLQITKTKKKKTILLN